VTTLTSATPSESTGEELALQTWLRWGRRVLDKKIYKEAIAPIRDQETKRNFDRHLARLAADSPTILRPNLRQKKRKVG
jgi:hypothetical protein